MITHYFVKNTTGRPLEVPAAVRIELRPGEERRIHHTTISLPRARKVHGLQITEVSEDHGQPQPGFVESTESGTKVAAEPEVHITPSPTPIEAPAPDPVPSDVVRRGRRRRLLEE